MVFKENHEKQQKSTKSTKINEKSIENPLKQSITSTADRQRAPGTSGVLWCCVVIIPEAPHTIPSVLETAGMLEERQIFSDRIKLFLVFFNKISFIFVHNPEKNRNLYTLKKHKAIYPDQSPTDFFVVYIFESGRDLSEARDMAKRKVIKRQCAFDIFDREATKLGCDRI